MYATFIQFTESETQNYPSVNNYCSAAQHSYAPHCASELQISGQHALAATGPMPLSPCTCILVNTYTLQHWRTLRAVTSNLPAIGSFLFCLSDCTIANQCASESANPSMSSQKKERRYHTQGSGITREGITRPEFLWQRPCPTNADTLDPKTKSVYNECQGSRRYMCHCSSRGQGVRNQSDQSESAEAGSVF